MNTSNLFTPVRFGLIGSAIALNLMWCITTADAAPQPASASVSSDGATYSGTYIYGPLNDSSSASPVSVANNNPGCSTSCAYAGSVEAYGSAHADPGGNIGAYAYARTPDGSTSNPYTSANDATIVHSNASFQNSAVVTSTIDPNTGHATLADGTPVQVSVSLLMDGVMQMDATDYTKASNPALGGYTASSNVSGTFSLYDPNVVYSGGEIGGIPISLVDFSANANGNNSGYLDAQGDFVPQQSADKTWTLKTNDSNGNNLSSQYSDMPYYCDGATQICGSVLTDGSGSPSAFSGSPLAVTFNTGVQTVTVDTYIGATLDWNGSLDVLNQAYGETASSYADFGNTFAVNLNPLTANTSLDFTYQQTPMVSTVPLPSSALLFGSGILVFASSRRRKQRKQ
jgi:hypothetical protein